MKIALKYWTKCNSFIGFAANVFCDCSLGYEHLTETANNGNPGCIFSCNVSIKSGGPLDMKSKFLTSPILMALFMYILSPGIY